ncbi:recombinase family protein [Dokdonella sp.]|uniref:recombinase family protein n=1 Tax=Dokdonella sp. TaxID=2291710 RepID=UPI0031C9395E|nr:recombinase family protein [Dokdonella sp.]
MGGLAKGERERRAVVYVRVSSVRQAEDGLPIESQLEQCQAKAGALGARVVKVFRDEGISGRTTRRPAFLEAMEYCEQHRVDFFVCWSTSRFARNRLDAALHKRTLQRLGTRLVYVSQDFGDTDDAWLTEAIIEVIDEQYSRTIAKDTRRSMAKNAADGFWNGGKVPFGFEVVPAGKRRKLAVLEREAVIVRTMFGWYLDGSGCKDISERLNAAGLLRRGSHWSKGTVANVLTNPAMMGCVSWTDRGELIVTPSHAGIVTSDEFERVATMMGARAPRNVGGTPKSEAVFSGILRCGHCQHALHDSGDPD